MFTLSILTVLAALFPAVIAWAGLILDLSGPAQVDGVDNLKVVTKLTNSGDETHLLNDPSSVLAPNWKTRTFDIQSDGGRIPPFVGVMVKYSLETAAANQFYTELVVGQSLEWTHNLGGVYNFSGTGASAYTIAPAPFTEIFTNVLSNGTLSLIEAVTDTSYVVELTGNLAPANYAGQEHYKRVVFQRCTPSQKTVLVRAYKNAQIYATGATSYLKKIKSGTTRYTTWFGQYTTTRKNLVLSRFTKMGNGQLAKATYDCTCTEPNAYAYVYPNQLGRIYLCGRFWGTPATGTDSKAGTLIHEISHFTANGGTEDYTYGKDSCTDEPRLCHKCRVLSLARTSISLRTPLTNTECRVRLGPAKVVVAAIQ